MDVGAWLRDLGLAQYEQAFVDNDIDEPLLPRLTAEDLKDLGVTSIGHRRRLLDAIADLEPYGPAAEQAAEPAPAEPPEDPDDRAPPEAERRQLTVLFCDLVGSTEMAARLDPEDMGRIIRPYQERCAATIEAWGGHVAKYMGDGVLAYFGYPRTEEDEAERAVRAALELVDRVRALETDPSVDLEARIGIATGRVVVGELIGHGAAQEHTVVGETPNLAARLEALAEPGSVVISPSTRNLLGALFDLADLGEHDLKGFSAPVQAWRVIGQGRAENRFEALRGRELTSLIGREHELGLLLERWTWATEGDGQAVLLSGEPGIGKSRIVRALRERLAGEAYTPLSHYSSPTTRTPPCTRSSACSSAPPI